MIDKNKLIHWLNIRKTTFDELNKKLLRLINIEIEKDDLNKLDKNSINKISEILDVPNSFLMKSKQLPYFIFKSKKELEETKRPITRDKIHFYNYYTLPSPMGYVAPVLIDILCPKEKLPKLNNGHLEPAITVSLGPNDIYARFGKKINKLNFCKFKTNKEKENNWVVGDNYFEPSYCLHTYSRATNNPGKILSYTTKSYVENLLSDKLNDQSFKNFVGFNKNLKFNRQMLKQEIFNRGYSFKELSKFTGVKLKLINDYFSNKNGKVIEKAIEKICNYLEINYAIFSDKKFKEDGVGKNYYSYKDSLKTKRKFKSYIVASMASSRRFQDLSGYFIKVFKKKKVLDLLDSVCSHYLVTNGSINFYSINDENETNIKMKKDDSIWVSAFCKHGFSGNGSLIKISDGQNINYLEKMDMINLYNPLQTLKRGRKDKINWGYDE
jgi:2-hydroxyethylphosphonate dioxygenase|tara:strand:- start:389 stop:1705 length:1317 start_codon:yes stop_codon:yes gene_type:complete